MEKDSRSADGKSGTAVFAEILKFPFFLRPSYDILLQTGVGSKEKRKVYDIKGYMA